MRDDRPIHRVAITAGGCALAVAFITTALLGQSLRSDKASPPSQQRSSRAQVLRSVGAVPADIVGEMREAMDFGQARSGQYFIMDRRAHAIYGLDAARTAAWKLVGIGQEPGRIINPIAFALDPMMATFIVLDLPDDRPRLQRFGIGGAFMGGFRLPQRRDALMAMSGDALLRAGALAYDGHSAWLSLPETGALVTEYSIDGGIQRSFGVLRATGQEGVPDVHLALNAGFPLLTPQGDVYFVFQAGIPVFRKYDKAGRLIFERHVEGPELDPLIQALPNTWPRRNTGLGREMPVVTPLIRAAAADPAGNLWVSLSVPYTFVYDRLGDRIRVLQFRAAGILAPTSLFFTEDGRLLVTPGCFEFEPWPAQPTNRIRQTSPGTSSPL